MARTRRGATILFIVTTTVGCQGADAGDSGESGVSLDPATSAVDPPGSSSDGPVVTTTAAPTSASGDPSGDTADTADTGDGPTGGSTGDTPADTGDAGDATTTDDGSTGEPVEGWSERSSARVFVSGHSLTDNPLVDDLALIADSLGRDFDYNQQIVLGSPIRVRTLGDGWDNLDYPGYSSGKNKAGSGMDVVAELLAPQTLGPGELYDTLVITERHDLLGTVQWEDTTGLLRHFHDRLIDGNPAGETLLYHSWLTIDSSAPQAWIDHEKAALAAWECVASKVNLTLEADGRPDRIKTLPVGAALVDLVERALADEVAGIAGSPAAKLGQIFSDGVHLTPTGVYFAALVTHTAVFRGSPVGAAHPGDVDPATAADLQHIAWDFVRAYYTADGVGVRTMEACRDLLSSQVCATFWTLQGQPGNIPGCQSHFADTDPNSGQNPFKWPDPDYMQWPPP